MRPAPQVTALTEHRPCIPRLTRHHLGGGLGSSIGAQGRLSRYRMARSFWLRILSACPILHLTRSSVRAKLVVRYGLQTVLDHATLTIHEGDRVGLVGRNGSGKSTFLQIAAGILQPDA